MRKTHLAVWMLVPVLLIAAALASASVQKQSLPSSYKKWLEEEVVYIITSIEKEVFLKLQSDRERDMFIEAFWKQRDPTPGTPDNEFRTEHYRRISHANRYLGRETPRPGWRTDRGRIYIILGEPGEIQRFDGSSGVYAAEIWFYQNKEDLGLPTGFNVVFFKEGGHGEYRLYSPTRDGPQALLAGYMGSPTNYEQAYQDLREIQPALASVSLSLVPGDSSGTFGRPSLSSDVLIQRIETTPQSVIRDIYARKFLEYKDIVEVEYTANYMDSEALLRVFRGPSTGTAFVHFAIQPMRLSVNQFDRRYMTTLKLNGNLTALDGRRVYQFDRTYNIELTEEQIRAANVQPFNLLDAFPIVPGEYRLSLLLKNEISKEFSSFEQNLSVPAEGAGILLTPPLLTYRTAAAGEVPGALRSFQLGPIRLYAQPNRVFLRNETLGVVFQVLGLDREKLDAVGIRVSFTRDGEIISEKSYRASQFPQLPNVVLEFDLSEFPPAHYGVRVAVVSGGRDIVTSAEEFDVTYAEAMPRPWVFSRLSPAAGSAVQELVLGTQFFNLGRISEARLYLERAAAGMPDSAEAALALANLLASQEEYASAAGVLEKFLVDDAGADYEVFIQAGTAFREAGDPGRALEIFEQAVKRFGINASLLNAVGECHFDLGNASEARAAWERSLELSSDQPEIRKKIENITKK
ncbi:MAG: GWxTD domain-containing protein [Acidobacteriota bacterium]|nr:GWxTD domain-containing protein [Acidobacteriota bacterium]